MSVEGARKALKTATLQLDRVQVASWDPQDPVQAVTFAFHAYENAVVAAAEAKAIRWAKDAYQKAELAGRLFREGVLRTNVEDRIRTLNEVRKDVSYDEPGPELRDVDLEDLAIELEEFIEEVQRIVKDAEP